MDNQKYDCDIVQDLLPLYQDSICSDSSKKMIEEHLTECADCSHKANLLKNTRIDEKIEKERDTILSAHAKKERKKNYIVAIVTAVTAITFVLVIAAVAYLFWNGGFPYISNDVSTYGDAPYERAYSSLELFPKRNTEGTKSGELKNHYVYFSETIFDPTIVLYAEWQYEEEEYLAEVERLSTAQSKYGNETMAARYEEENYSQPSYVTMEDINECYEYALLDEETFTIRYAYLQFANKWIIKFSEEYLPKDF